MADHNLLWLTAIMEEYKALNAEILERNTPVFSVGTACLAAAVVIVGLIINTKISGRDASVIGVVWL